MIYLVSVFKPSSFPLTPIHVSLTHMCVCVFVCVSLVRWLWLCSIKHRAGYSDVLSSLSLSLFSLRHCAAISLSLLPSNNMSSLLHCSDSTVKLMRTNSSACVSLTFLISALHLPFPSERPGAAQRGCSQYTCMCVSDCFLLVLFPALPLWRALRTNPEAFAADSSSTKRISPSLQWQHCFGNH